jgi:hypothetical protein
MYVLDRDRVGVPSDGSFLHQQKKGKCVLLSQSVIQTRSQRNFGRDVVEAAWDFGEKDRRCFAVTLVRNSADAESSSFDALGGGHA